MRTLSKSRIIAFRQCPKKLWLSIHQPKQQVVSAEMQSNFDTGNRVGDLARKLYDPEYKGYLIDPKGDGYDAAIARSTELLQLSQPIFEAGFTAEGVMAFADVMLPVGKGKKKVWRMIEVKSSTSVKEYYRDDIAIQAFLARSNGVPLASISLAHINSDWVYPGKEYYQGLLVEHDLTEEAFSREGEVQEWIADAHKVARKRTEPKIVTSRHCDQPNECGFLAYCQNQEPQTKYPVSWLPSIQSKALKSLIEDEVIADMRKVPDELLNDRQLRVKTHTLANKVFFDAENAAADLAAHKLPAYFIDFETIQFAIPVWKGTHPYQNTPFQFSVQRLSRTGKLEPQSFIDLSGKDPSKAFAEQLIAACGERGPVFVYNAGFETARITELAGRIPRLKSALLAINSRIVDLLPIARERYYNPSQQGSWSIKKVLPAIAPDLGYEALEGVQDGQMAMNAYLEAISPDTTTVRKAEIEQQLLKYCNLDTYAMVRLWQFFTGKG